LSDSIAVTVVVPFLDGEPTIGDLIRGLASQVPNALGQTEFVFVDNGSTDGGRALAEASGLPSARVVDQPIPGVSAARNAGLEVARGGVVAVVDCDCVPTRQWLRELVEPFTDPAVVLAAGGLASYPPRTGAQRFAALYGLNDATRNIDMPVIPFANGRNMAVRTEAARVIGGWPEDMEKGDDIEFSYRLRQRFDCAIEYRPRALVFHQDRETDEDLCRQAHGYGRGIAYLYERHPDLLEWSWRERARRIRMSMRRQLSATISRAGAATGRVDPGKVEFARYLAMWDHWFWRGFFDARRKARA
jgi:glycosyltransferase involved in cell wall biosynthesis